MPHVDYSKRALDAFMVLFTNVLEGVYDFAEFKIRLAGFFS